MASFLTDLAKPFVEKLINGAIAELSYICCFTCIVKDFQEEQSRLEVERETLERHIEEATRRGENVQPDALAWKDEVDQLIQQDTKKKQKCFFEFCPDCLWRYSRGKLLAKMKGRIKILMVTRKELTIGLPAHLPDIERWTTQHYVHLKSRESQYTKLLVELKDDNNYMIGLQGMGGTGKTTLIKKVGKELKQSKQFTQVIDTTVSFSPNIKKIQDDIAGPLGLKFDDCNDSDRPKKLWRRLTNGERILLILDDVWGDVDFNEIGIPSSDNHKGCRIIVTTRNVSVCNKLGCNKTIQLGLLSKEDAWIMFKKYANLSETSTRFFLDKGRKIANECKNLPIAIAVIASSLKGKQLPDEWDMALKFLKKDISRNSDDDDDDDVLEIYKCLKFSYDKLDEKAKSLFLLCSVFREDEDIHTESLTRFAIGGGLFGKDYGSYEEARSRVVKSKNKLLDSCLLLTSGQRSVKMHDFARDAAQWIANNKIQTIKVYDKTQKAMLEREKNIKYLSCEGNQEEVFSCKFDGSKLEILIVIIDMARDFSDNEIQVPDSFFGNNTNLRVLHLRSVCSSLPQSMQQLKNIRSLIFTRCALGDISIFGNLQSLEELDMAHCKINEMPNGITELKKFRLLKLESCSIDESNPFEVIKRCSSLQELYFVYDSRFLYGEITWPKLQRFHVSDREIDFSISKYVSIEWTDEIFLSETTLKYCMQEAEVLRLIRIEGEWRNIIPDIVHMDQVGICPKQYHTALPLLKKLVLKNCLWTANTKSINDFVPRHYVSRSVNCTTMKELNGSMEDLLALEKINLSNSKIESIFCVNNEVNEQQVNLVLQSIELENLNVMVCPFVGPKNSFNLQNLTKMTIMGCEKLQIIFTVSILRCLPQLDQLMIHACEELKHIVEEDLDNQNMSNSSSCFPKLKGLSVQKCNKLKSVFPVSICNKLPELKALIITKAKELEEIFKSSEGGGIENFMIPNLKLVVFRDLPNLFQTQEIQVHRTKYRFIEGCDKISLTSTLRSTQTNVILDLINDVRGTHYTPYFAKLHLVMSTTKILLISYVFVCLYMQTATKSIRLEYKEVYILNFKHPFNFKQGNGISVEQGTTSTNSKTTTSSSPIVTSEHNSSSQAPMDELTIDQQSPLEETDDATVTPSQELINEQSMTQHQSLPESHATIKPSKGNNDIKISVEGGKATTNAKTLASSTSKGETLSLLVKKELEQLVSEKHLNYETLSLLTDFLVKHPSVILKDTLLTNRYKGYAYNCLAELLKFLQTHSVLDVLGSSHSEFVGLIQDMRKFSFNKDWLDGVEKRALFPDLQFSRDAMQKLLDSKKHVTKQVEEMRLKLYFFNQHAEDIKHQLTSSEAVLASIIQQEEHVLETTAALSVPLGY
ncbi:hypothetical protein RYX36_012095 [Vicia faba]